LVLFLCPDICGMEKIIVTTPEELSAMLDERIRLAFKHYAPQSQATPIPGRAMTLSDAVTFTGISKSTIYKLTAAGEIPHGKRGKKLYFDRHALDAWLLERPAHTKSDTEKAVNQFLANAGSRRIA